MLYSRKQISKAGKILITSKDLNEIKQALTLINEWRSHHVYPLNILKNSLKRLLKNNNLKPILISQRLKRLISIENKLDLNENMGLGGMQDIGGFRAVMKDTADLNKLKTLLINRRKTHKLLKIYDYVKKPKTSGYRSIHFIYEYKSKITEHDKLKIELQIRTKLQHNWATAVETAGLYTKSALKSSNGPDEWLKFFKIISSIFAIKENLPVLSIHEGYSLKELMVKCYEISNELNIIFILKALRISAKHIEIDNINGEYFILNIDINSETVTVSNFKKSDFQKAIERYQNLEQEISNNENEVVLVTSDSIESLKKAYPSYFLDTSEFIEAIEKINQNCKKYNYIS